MDTSQCGLQDQASFAVTPGSLFMNQEGTSSFSFCVLHGEWSEHWLFHAVVSTDSENGNKTPFIGLTRGIHSEWKHLSLSFLVEFSQGVNNGNSAAIKIHTSLSSHLPDDGWRLAKSCSLGYSILETIFQQLSPSLSLGFLNLLLAAYDTKIRTRQM